MCSLILCQGKNVASAIAKIVACDRGDKAAAMAGEVANALPVIIGADVCAVALEVNVLNSNSAGSSMDLLNPRPFNFFFKVCLVQILCGKKHLIIII